MTFQLQLIVLESYADHIKLANWYKSTKTMASGPPPKLIRVSGTSGSNAARLNGQYKLRKQKVGNRVSYVTTKKQKDKMIFQLSAIEVNLHNNISKYNIITELKYS